MVSVQARITGIESLQNVIATKEKELVTLRQELAMRNGQLRAELAKGCTTGDPLRDLVIRAHGIDLALTENYRSVEEKLKCKTGEFVMVLYHAKVRQRYGGRISESDYRHETHFRIGMLTTERLKLMPVESLMTSSPITLPIDKYIGGVWPESGFYLPSLDDAPVYKDLFEWGGIDDRPYALLEYFREEHLIGHLSIGDNAVRAKLAEVRDDKTFAAAAEKLGRLILEPTN